MTLAVISHVAHRRHEGRVWAYAPYAAEMRLWAELFGEVVILAPEADGPPRGDEQPIEAENVRLEALPRIDGGRGGRLMRFALAMPRIAAMMSRQMRRADVAQVRCPGNYGFIGWHPYSPADSLPNTPVNGARIRASRGATGCRGSCSARDGGGGAAGGDELQRSGIDDEGQISELDKPARRIECIEICGTAKEGS